MFTPHKMFLTKGVGEHREELQSFELALRQAGIQKLNIVSVSSIFPPGCEIITREKGLAEVTPGQITFCVLARCSSNEPRRQFAASIGVAIPTDTSMYGYLSEHHAYGQTDEEAGDYHHKNQSQDYAVVKHAIQSLRLLSIPPDRRHNGANQHK